MHMCIQHYIDALANIDMSIYMHIYNHAYIDLHVHAYIALYIHLHVESINCHSTTPSGRQTVGEVLRQFVWRLHDAGSQQTRAVSTQRPVWSPRV